MSCFVLPPIVRLEGPFRHGARHKGHGNRRAVGRGGQRGHPTGGRAAAGHIERKSGNL